MKGILSVQILCGLMIGAIVPDFGYFIRDFGMASFAHTVAGSFGVSLPVGLAVYLLVRLLFGRIADTLPRPHSSFLRSWGIDKPSTKRNLLGVAVAILLGAFSHNFVDSFTHESGVAVAMFPELNKEAFYLGGEPVHVYRILQYAGSFLGMAMIVAAYWFGLRRHCRERGCRVWQDSRSWMVLLGLIEGVLIAQMQRRGIVVDDKEKMVAANDCLRFLEGYAAAWTIDDDDFVDKLLTQVAAYLGEHPEKRKSKLPLVMREVLESMR